jgi:hypothetical protein
VPASRNGISSRVGTRSRPGASSPGRRIAGRPRRFPWGSSLALRCGSWAAPLDVASGVHPPPAPSTCSIWMLSNRSPSHSRGQGRGESAKLFAVASFGQSRSGAPLTDAFSAPRMQTRRDPSRILSSLHRTVPTSDVPVVTLRHTRVGFRIRPMCFAAGVSPLRSAALRTLT